MFHFSFSTHHHRTARVRQLRRFRCRACSPEQYAWITGFGAGVGRSPFAQFDAGAIGQAQLGAQQSALAYVELHLALATCPKCGATPWLKARLPTIVGLTVIGLVVLRLDWWYVKSDPNV